VKGVGYTFGAPPDWTVKRGASSVAVTSGKVDLVQVSYFRLEKPYRVARFEAVSKELDRVADGVAKQVRGRVASRKTIQVAGRKTRSYRIDYDGGTTEEIAFVLEAQNEYQLLCRRRLADSDAVCVGLFSTFRLAGT
jgi:hypothetical protein